MIEGARTVRVSLVWAQTESGVIGRAGALPWRLPTDMAYFRALTLGKPCIMGRRTFDSLPKPLAGRMNIVVTRARTWQHQRARTAHSIEAALSIAASQARADNADELIVMGGAEIYARALPRADRLYVTIVHDRFEGDTYFPAVDCAAWVLRRELHPADQGMNEPLMRFLMFERDGVSEETALLE